MRQLTRVESLFFYPLILRIFAQNMLVMNTKENGRNQENSKKTETEKKKEGTFKSKSTGKPGIKSKTPSRSAKTNT
jgi:hypothetical protein